MDIIRNAQKEGLPNAVEGDKFVEELGHCTEGERQEIRNAYRYYRSFAPTP